VIKERRKASAKFIVLACLFVSFLCGSFPAPVYAEKPFYDIAAQPLEAALIEFAKKAKLSIDFSNIDLTRLTSTATNQHISKTAALRDILKGTGLTFEFLDRTSVKVTVKRSPVNGYPEKAKPDQPKTNTENYIEDLIVTAAKRKETSFRLPVSVSAVSSLVLEDLNTYSFQSLAPYLAGVSTTNLGPGRNKIFIRGLSDGPFADRTQAMVGVYIDETPINFSDTNPDIRLFDVERVELIRGPQGTLYGAGSLGGIYRVITAKPNLTDTSGKIRIAGSSTAGGNASGLLDFVFNKPVIEDKLGFRLSGYADIRGGYIDDIALDLANSNDLNIFGIRPALRWKFAENWTLDASANIQSIRYEDSQYYFEELGRNIRTNALPEPYADDFIQFNLTLKGEWGPVLITSSSSFIDRSVTETADATNGLPFLENDNNFSGNIFTDSGLFRLRGAEEFISSSTSGTAYFTRDDIQTFSHETRLQSRAGKRFEWLLGGFFLKREQKATSALVSSLEDEDGDLLLLENRNETTQDIALFGEAIYHVTDKLSITSGARYAHTTLDLNYESRLTFIDASISLDQEKSTSKLIPKLALRYQWSDSVQSYAQVAMGYRVGGININTPLEAFIAAEPDEDVTDEFKSGFFQSDEVINYELGLKSFWFDRRLSLNVAAFLVDWFDIQSDQLGTSGLPFTTNVGNARSIGYELEFSARLLPGLELRGSFFWNDAKLKEKNNFLGAQKGDRLPTIAEKTTSLALLYQFDLGPDWTTTLAVDYAYVGPSALTFDENNSPKMGNYGILNARIQVANSLWKFGISAENLTDTSANTFAFGNSFLLTEGNQITPPRPRTIGIFVERSF